MVDKFFKVTYIKDKKKFLKSDLYIGPREYNQISNIINMKFN